MKQYMKYFPAELKSYVEAAGYTVFVNHYGYYCAFSEEDNCDHFTDVVLTDCEREWRMEREAKLAGENNNG